MSGQTSGPWSVGQTYSTHNHPERYWETSVQGPAGLVARSSGATQAEAEELAALIVEAQAMAAVLRDAVAVLDAEGILYGDSDEEPLDVLREARAILDRLDAAGAAGGE